MASVRPTPNTAEFAGGGESQEPIPRFHTCGGRGLVGCVKRESLPASLMLEPGGPTGGIVKAAVLMMPRFISEKCGGFSAT